MESKTVIYTPETGGGNLQGILPALLQKQGIDPSVLALMSNGGFGGFGNNGIFDILLLFILLGAFGRGGFGGNNGNNEGTSCVMQAVQRNGFDINTLATALNTTTTNVMQAINALGTQICNVGYQLGQSTSQIVTALMQGNNAIQSQIASCCCDLKQILSQGFASIGFETAKQTCAIEKAIADSTAQILAGQRAAEMREMQDKLDAAREKNSLLQGQIDRREQTAIVGQMIQQATQPLAGAIGALQSDVDGIKCKLPQTVTLPYSDAKAVRNYDNSCFGAFNGWNWGNNGWW